MPFDGRARGLLKKDTTYKERLLRLCQVLESVSDDAFDLRDWQRNGACRTVACAVGWAVKDSWFKEQGLSHSDRSPAYDSLGGWKAVRSFFGLSRDEAFYLFQAGRYEDPGRGNVIARIRTFAESR